MKTANHVFRFVLVILYGFSYSTEVEAQTRKIDFFEPGDRAQSFFVEAGGPGFISANYDTRLQNSRNSWGIRGGIGYLAFDGQNLLTIPMQVNYLLGKNGHYFEMGAGASYVRSSWDDYFYYDANNNWVSSPRHTSENRVMGSLSFGYRRQPVDSGFLFRAGLSPIFYDSDFIPYLPHISFGYAF